MRVKWETKTTNALFPFSYDVGLWSHLVPIKRFIQCYKHALTLCAWDSLLSPLFSSPSSLCLSLLSLSFFFFSFLKFLSLLKNRIERNYQCDSRAERNKVFFFFSEVKQKQRQSLFISISVLCYEEPPELSPTAGEIFSSISSKSTSLSLISFRVVV